MVVPLAEVGTKIRIGKHQYPITLLLMDDWRYEVIIGLSFLSHINASINVRNNSISVGTDQHQCCTYYSAISNKRSFYDVIVKQFIDIPEMTEARIVAEISGILPDNLLYLQKIHHFHNTVDNSYA